MIVSNVSSTSLFIMISLVTPFTIIEYLKATRSIHPQRRLRPVTEPNSCPRVHILSPVSSNNSVGKGPEPTRVQYALKIPYTSPMRLGATPKPVQAPAHTVFEEVTNGYEPKSISSIVPWAPSQRTLLPSFNKLFTSCSLSTKWNCFKYSIPSIQAFSGSVKSYS